jgi:adenylate cyclase
VPGDFASRRHVCIELRFDKFVLVDQSSNGTYVHPKNGEMRYLSREEMILQGSGTISLNKPDTSHPTELVEYTINITAG